MPFHKGTPPLRQRGALGILGGLVLLLSVLFTALAVDTGRLMLEHRRLQLVADMAALDASSQSGGCGDGTLALAEAAAQTSATRNNHSIAEARTLDVLLGNVLVGTGGVRNFAQADPETSMAVQVTAGNTVPASLFAGGLLGREATLQATAVAERQALTGFCVGSGLLSFNTQDSIVLNALFGEVLGSPVTLDAVSYQGITNASVSLLSLVEATIGAGTVDELLHAPLAVGDLLQIYADALNASGVVDVEVLAAMQALVSAAVRNLSLELGEVLKVTAPNVEEAASAEINLFDLVTSTAIVANGQNALVLPLAIDLSGLTAEAELKVIELPQIAIGPPGKDDEDNWRTEAQTAQIELDVIAEGSLVKGVVGTLLGEGVLSDLLAGLFNLLGALLGSSDLIDVDVDLSLKIKVAKGRAWLESIQCARQGVLKSLVTIGVEKGIAEAELNADVTLNLKVVRLLLLPSYEDIKVPLSLSLTLSDSIDESLEFDVNSDDLPAVQRASSSFGQSLVNALESGGLNNDNNVDEHSLGVAGGLVASILSTIAPILDSLLRVLGLEIGYVDVELFEVKIGRSNLLI